LYRFLSGKVYLAAAQPGIAVDRFAREIGAF
jgi:hypothetical protein